MQLITDRTEADMLAGNEKGIYGHTDLNRVEQAVSELCVLAEGLGIGLRLSVKTDWGLPGAFTADSWPAESQMLRYIQNVHALCDAVQLPSGGVPQTMAHLTWQGANAIEKALEQVYQRLQGILKAYRYSGEMFAGEESYL